MEKEVYISTNIEKMNVAFIHEYLSKKSYWAKGRSKAHIQKSMQHSLCFGAFTPNDEQIGFARVATDYVVFAWVMDVFVSEDKQGQKIGEKLMDAIVNHPELKGVNGIGLRTHDAQKFYNKFGFSTIPKPETWMFKSKD